MWQTKTFKTRPELVEWIERNYYKYQIVEIAVNNAFAVEYKKVRII